MAELGGTFSLELARADIEAIAEAVVKRQEQLKRKPLPEISERTGLWRAG